MKQRNTLKIVPKPRISQKYKHVRIPWDDTLERKVSAYLANNDKKIGRFVRRAVVNEISREEGNR